MEIPVWDGNAATHDTYSQDVELLLPGTEHRTLLGPRLASALPAKSPQRKLAVGQGKGASRREWRSRGCRACRMREGLPGARWERRSLPAWESVRTRISTEVSVMQRCPDDQAERGHSE